MSSLVSFVPSRPADWEMFFLNAANVLLGLVVAGFVLLLVGESIVEIVGRRKPARRHGGRFSRAG